MRIVQLCLLLSILVLFIYIAIMDESHLVTMFYASIIVIVVIGLKFMQWNDEFIDNMNKKIEERAMWKNDEFIQNYESINKRK